MELNKIQKMTQLMNNTGGNKMNLLEKTIKRKTRRKKDFGFIEEYLTPSKIVSFGNIDGHEYAALGQLEGVEVILSNTLLESLDGDVGAHTFVNFGEGFKSMIILDDNFLRLPKRAQTFTLYHELGHAKDPEIEMSTIGITNHFRNLSASLGSIHSTEKFADDYAFNNLGRKNTLIGIVQLTRYFSKKYGLNVELIQRTERLLKKGRA